MPSPAYRDRYRFADFKAALALVVPEALVGVPKDSERGYVYLLGADDSEERRQAVEHVLKCYAPSAYNPAGDGIVCHPRLWFFRRDDFEE